MMKRNYVSPRAVEVAVGTEVVLAASAPAYRFNQEKETGSGDAKTNWGNLWN